MAVRVRLGFWTFRESRACLGDRITPNSDWVFSFFVLSSPSHLVSYSLSQPPASRQPPIPNLSLNQHVTVTPLSAAALLLASQSLHCRFRSSKGGAGVLERPKFDQSQFDPATQLEQGGDIGRLKDKRGIGSRDSYRVLLVDDVRHTEKLDIMSSSTPSTIAPTTFQC
ncbi:uncharacterized protein LOC109950412 [Prunus persica]|uniref:uncharacterized protein LOC109950412 n=1 Tax=Prunus persica TaxID=3760 RepID=UPI0009AB2E0E|nr:uncharacterized protein LOC109950412 [Prunus persica]